MPDSNFFTIRTWAACWSGSKVWMTPMPPVRHGDRHLILGHVHRRGDDRYQPDPAGDAGADIDFDGSTSERPFEQHVVGMKPSGKIADLGHNQLQLTGCYHAVPLR
jgi:hypothetical protein